jgi:aminopeptidase
LNKGGHQLEYGICLLGENVIQLDKRWDQVADVLVHYSTGVKAGERVMIAMHEIETLPLVRAVYEEAVKAGAHVQVQFLSEYLKHSLIRYGRKEQIEWMPEIEAYGMEWADVYFGLRGAHNLYELADVSPELLAAHQRALGKISALRWQKTRWCLVRVPDESFAQQAESDVETVMDFFFSSILRDWEIEATDWRRIANVLGQGEEVRLVGKDTDLRFSTRGRYWLVGDGHVNMPDGEIYTAPVTHTVNGHIYFEFPGVLGGRLVPDIHLEWKDGQLIQAHASQNEGFLREILATDAGASVIGEFGIGVNYGIDRFCKDILVDEKIGGTVHIALGRAYAGCGGDNQSALHWDIVKDTRAEGAIYLDGRKVFENGRFLI